VASGSSIGASYQRLPMVASPCTANKDLSALSSPWKFAARAVPAKEGVHKLPFEDHKVVRLLSANHASLMLKDAIPTPCRSSCGGAKARMLVGLFSRSFPPTRWLGAW
jgi:hypothetical protein